MMATGRTGSANRLASGIVSLICALGAVSGAQQTPRAHRTAPSPQLPPLAITQIEDRSRGQDLDGRTLSIRSAEPLAIKDLLILLFRDTDFSIVLDPDVAGVFSGELRNVTLRQALELVLHPLGLDFELQGQSIHVFRRRTETRIFDVDYVITQRTARRSMSAATALTGRGLAASGGETDTTPSAGDAIAGSSTQVASTDGADFFQELAAGVQTLLSPDGRFNLDRKAAMVQVTDYPDRLDRIALYLDAAQTRVLRQVQIQARVVEVDLRQEHHDGIDWSLVLGSGDASVSVTQAPAPVPGRGLAFGLRIKDLQGLLRVLGRQGVVNVLSSPRVVAMNNEPAIMRVGTQDVFFVTTSQVDAISGRILQTTATPQAITEGIVLSVTPQIAADGAINMSISPTITERTGQATSRFGDTVPILSVRESDTLVRVYEGETIVIAGLMQERTRIQQDKVPVLGDIPGIGRAFRRDHRVKGKTDLVILLTPTVITPAKVTSDAARERDRIDRLQRTFARPPEDKQP